MCVCECNVREGQEVELQLLLQGVVAPAAATDIRVSEDKEPKEPGSGTRKW